MKVKLSKGIQNISIIVCIVRKIAFAVCAVNCVALN